MEDADDEDAASAAGEPHRQGTRWRESDRLEDRTGQEGRRYAAVKGDAMAKASKKSMGAGAHGKGSGIGALTDVPKDRLGENMVLSNRDKKQHSAQRGNDSKEIQNEQLQGHEGNKYGG